MTQAAGIATAVCFLISNMLFKNYIYKAFLNFFYGLSKIEIMADHLLSLTVQEMSREYNVF